MHTPAVLLHHKYPSKLCSRLSAFPAFASGAPGLPNVSRHCIWAKIHTPVDGNAYRVNMTGPPRDCENGGGTGYG